jgi:glutathione synthase/RimK-type ligase-like ATP-grasp enzyme
MKIAYITYSGTFKYSPANNFNETQDLLPFLQNKGLDISAEIWDDPTVDWEKYDVALLKTPWDYHQKYDQFKLWLDKIQSLNIRLLNDYSIVRWNMDKHYLLEVADSGFDIIPSIFLQQGWNEELKGLFEKLDSEKLIIKPCVSGGSKNTIVLSKNTTIEDKGRVLELISVGDYIVQPLMPQIQEGEWSFIFLNGKYSHTIIKKPKAGDFRVQQIFGGTIEAASPAQEYIDLAEQCISRFAKGTMYARVDGLMVDGRFMLMELELIEPFLYLSYHSEAVEKYYSALIEQLAI